MSTCTHTHPKTSPKTYDHTTATSITSLRPMHSAGLRQQRAGAPTKCGANAASAVSACGTACKAIIKASRSLHRICSWNLHLLMRKRQLLLLYDLCLPRRLGSRRILGGDLRSKQRLLKENVNSSVVRTYVVVILFISILFPFLGIKPSVE